MTLSPEERQHIYEEERARREAQDGLKTEANRKRGLGCLFAVGGFVVIMIAIAVVGSLMNPSDKSRSVSTDAPGVPPAPTITKVDLLKKAGTFTDGLHDMKTGLAGESMDYIKLTLDVFDGAASILQQLQSQTLTDEERTRVAALRKLLILRQREAFPVIRGKVGPIFSTELWMSDGKARTLGARYTTVEFVSGSFAANANIETAHQAIRGALTRMRFKRAQYKWYAEQDEFSYYTIASPGDGDVAVIGIDGNVTPVPE